ncbi:MAG: HEPN domain-containing protein, partial [Alphaproteobacteria bacterium]
GLREERALAASGRRKKQRKTSLSHLPKAKRAEILWVKKLIFAEFEEAIAGRRAPEVRDGTILKLVLHGPHASGAWVDDPNGRYFADYDFLVLVSSDRLADVGEFWLECEKRLLFASVNGENLRTPVRLTILSFERFSDQINQGNRYFQNIMEECVVLHDADPTAWPECTAVAALDVAAEAEFHLEEGLALVAELLGSAKLSAANGWFRKAAFDLHQATERLYNIALLVLVGRTPHTHNIVELRKLAESASEQLRVVWPTETKEDRRCFELLRAAYNKSRYNRHYRVADSEAAWMIEQVEYLSDLVNEVCDAWIDRLHNPQGERVPTLRLDAADARRKGTGEADDRGHVEGEQTGIDSERRQIRNACAVDIQRPNLRTPILRQRWLHTVAESQLPQRSITSDERQLLAAAVTALPEPIRDVFLLCRISGLSCAEIAHHLDLDIHLVEKRLSEALIALGQAVPFETTG